MMFTAGTNITIPPMVSVYTNGIGWTSEVMMGASPASASYDEADNEANYFPILLPVPCVVRRVWWANGATVSGAATIEVGIYADSGYGPGAKIISGSATQGSALQVQFVDVTDTSLPPGLYWLALVSSSTSVDFMRGLVQTTAMDAARRFYEINASPLPSTATPLESINQSIYLCGFSTTASP